MARRTIHVLIDDMTGKDAGENGETILFSLDGTQYTIDLSGSNAEAFRKAMKPYVEKAERVRGAGRVPQQRKPAGNSTSAADRGENEAIRAWAKQQGMEVSDRGRIAKTIQEAYAARNSAPAQPPQEAPKKAPRKAVKAAAAPEGGMGQVAAARKSRARKTVTAPVG